jgi:transcriptional regulator PpsR
VASLIAAGSDFAVVLDMDGVVTDVLVSASMPALAALTKLIGTPWANSLARDSQRKVALLLEDARAGRSDRSREINQIVEGVGEFPLRFTAVLLDGGKHVVALGRDLSPVANLQQRMLAAQQSMDREFAKLRQADARYRLLFHVSNEGVLVADSPSGRIQEANPTAASILGEPAQTLQGRSVVDLFEPTTRANVQSMLAAVGAGSRPLEVKAVLEGPSSREMNVAAAMFRQSGAPMLLVRMWSTTGAVQDIGSRTSRMLTLLDAMPDGFVVIGEDRRVLCANSAFCDMVQAPSESRVIGEPLERWLGRPGVDLNIILANLREHGTVRNFATVMRVDVGPAEEATVTAVNAQDGKVPCYGFTIRSERSSVNAAPVTLATGPRTVDQLRELVGRVPLKELVRESSDMIERLCIEAALDVCGNNRASAAQLLGLSRQGLYSKLRRHGLSEFDPA